MRKTGRRTDNAAFFAGTTAEPVRRCEHPGCESEGLYRAPRSRSLDGYRYLCLEHVREVNRAWNYCAGMTAEEVEAMIRADTVWRRPTWPLGGRRGGPGNGAGPVWRDDFGIFGPDGPGTESPAEAARRRPQTPEEQALQELEMTTPTTFPEIRLRYKELVKRHHPDANGGDKAAEERLKRINQAYATLKSAYAP